MMIYLLSILDQLSFVAKFFMIIGTIALVLTLLIGLIILRISFEERDEKDAESLRRISGGLLGYALKGFLPVVIIFSLLSCLTPKKSDLVKAYMIIEGSKIVTADNAEKVLVDVGGKIDAFIQSIDGKTPGKAPKGSSSDHTHEH